MPVRTEVELATRLDGDIAWRKHELTTLLFVVQGSSPPQVQPLLRSGICLLYAHWEGFVTSAAKSYLEHVANRRLRYRELKANFLAAGVRLVIRSAVTQRNIDADMRLIKAIEESRQQRMPKDVASVIESKSNLNAKVFRSIQSTIGVECSWFTALDKMKLDSRLLKHRNAVAHGEWLVIDKDDYTVLHSWLIDLISTFRDDLLDAASKRQYRRGP